MLAFITFALLSSTLLARTSGTGTLPIYGNKRDLLARRIEIIASERVKRNQFNPHASPVDHMKRTKLSKPCPSNTAPICRPIPVGKPTHPSCDDNGGSDGSIDKYYSVSATGVHLKSKKFQDNGHVNFKYIPCEEYKGKGSHKAKPASWHEQSGNIHFESRNNQPSGKYIGKSDVDFAAAFRAPASLPVQGYCITWVQVDGFIQHFGEGGQAPVCTAQCCK